MNLKAKTPSEITAWMFEKYSERKDSKWVRLEDAQKEIDFQKARVDVANEMVTSKQKRIDELKQKLQQILKEFKTTNENTSCSLVVEESHNHFCPLKKIIEELLKEEKEAKPHEC